MRTQKYMEASHDVDLQPEKVKKALDETEHRELSRLLDSMNALSCIQDEHLFRATLRLAWELGRVGSA